MAAIVVAGCAVTIAFGERIGVNRGQGWDGMSYTQWGQDFWGAVIRDGLSRYHAQRVLPSAVVHYVLALIGQRPTADHVLRAFAVLDTALLAGSSMFWAHLGAVMKWRRAATWVGFIALFGCFANARHALYYPALTDPAAFALGVVLVWAYLTDRPVAVWICAACGLVTWPALPPVAIAMLVLPRPRASIAEIRHPRWLALALACDAAIGFCVIAGYYDVHPLPGVGDDKFAGWVDRDLLVITVPLLFAMLATGWYFALDQDRLWNVRGYIRQLSRRRLAITAASVVVLVAARTAWLHLIGTRGEGPTGAQFLCEHTLAAIRGPLWGPVHHVVYFGPIVLVAAIAWRRIAAIAAAWGPAIVIALALILAFAAGSNSRQWNHLFPLLVALAVAATADSWTPWRTVAFGAIAVAWSKIWLVIGYDTPLAWHEFPNQRYFMNTGPYAADGPYFVHLVAAIFTLLVLLVVLRPGQRNGIQSAAARASVTRQR